MVEHDLEAVRRGDSLMQRELDQVVEIFFIRLDLLQRRDEQLFVPGRAKIHPRFAQLTGIEVSSDGRLFVSEENYLGTSNGIASFTPPVTTFNPTPTAITGRIYFDRVIVSDAIPTNLPSVVTSPDVVDGGTVAVKVGQTLDMSFLATDPEGADMTLTVEAWCPNSCNTRPTL